MSPWWQDANKPQKWGFACLFILRCHSTAVLTLIVVNQVTPFNISTSDTEHLYAWHVLPLPIYSQHEDQLLKQPAGFCDDISKSESFRILKDDPDAKVILYCKLQLFA